MLNKGITNISGVSEGRVAKAAGELINENRGQYIIITASYLKAKRLASDLSFFVDKPIFVLPAEDEIFVKYEAKSHHELLDTYVDSIRSFDIDTQRSIENLKYVEIFPSENLLNEDDLFQKAIENIKEVYGKEIKKAEKKGEEQRQLQLIKRRDQLVEFAENTTNLQLLENYLHYFYDELEYLWDYMNKDGILLIDDPDRIYETIENRTKEIHDDFKLLLERGNAVPKDAEIFSGHNDFLKALNKPVIYLFTPFQKAVKGIERVNFIRNIQSKQGPVFNGRMDSLETELKKYVKNKNKKADSKSQTIQSFSDLRSGDFVVHENHGIGKFTGISQLTVQGVKKDYLKIKYAGEDSLYVPVEQMDLIQKY